MIEIAQQSNIIDFPLPQGKSNEWYTPSRYIEAAREVMGDIDLDPASCADANRIVKAKRYFTKQDNGLMQPWYGKVYCNPPYGRTNNYIHSNIGLFANKLVDEYQTGNVTQAILLSTGKTSTSWFHRLWEYPICFVDHIVGFYVPSREREAKDCSHIHGTIFVYLGKNEQKFINEFQRFGTVARRVSAPKQEVRNLGLWEGER